jgi:hypothetical protein
MEAFLFASLNRKTLASTLGDTSWTSPDFFLGDKSKFTLRLTQNIGGREIEVDRTIESIRCSLGRVDARPTGGTFALKIEGTGREFTANSTTDTLTALAHGLADGDRVRVSSNDALPDGLFAATDYYVLGSTANDFQLALTDGGAAVDFSDDGTGTHTLENLSVDVHFDDTAATAAQDFQDAINGLADVGAGKTYDPVVVEIKDGSWIATGPDLIPLKVAANSLAPVTFARIANYSSDDDQVTEVRLVQAPVAFQSVFAQVVPKAPYFINPSPQDGGEFDLNVWPEIKALFVPPNFRGSFQVRRSGKRSTLLSKSDGSRQIKSAIDPLADDGGEFTVTNPRPNVAHIRYDGTMEGINWADDDLEIVVFDAPAGDFQIDLDQNTSPALAILRADDNVPLVLEFEVTYQDEQDAQIKHRSTFRQDVNFRREVGWDELENTPNQNWLRPPLPNDYYPFNATQVIPGQQHYPQVFGNGTLAPAVIAHGLNTEEIASVVVRQNVSGGLALVHGSDYTWTVDNANQVTIQVLANYGTPGVDTLVALITSAGPVSTFVDNIEIELGQVNGLGELLDSMLSDIKDLKLLAPTKVLSRTEDFKGGSTWLLPQVFDLFPLTQAPVLDATPEKIYEIPQEVFQDAYGRTKRPGALLPAVHDETPESLAAILVSGELPESDASRKGKVFVNDSGGTVEIPGGGGRLGRTLATNDYLADDGRFFYKVVPYGVQAGTVFTAESPQAFTGDDADDLLTVVGHGFADDERVRLYTTGTLPAGLALATDYYVETIDDDTIQLLDAPAGIAVDLTDTGTGVHTLSRPDVFTSDEHRLDNGDRVQLSSTGTLPAGLVAATDYYVQDRTASTYGLAATVDGDPIVTTDVGTGVHTITKQGDVSFYPVDFERTLFDIAVNDQQLRIGKVFETLFGLELGLLKATSKVTCVLVIEIGDMPQDLTPATPGFNIKNAVWRPSPAVEIPLTLTPVPSRHVAGVRIKRTLSGITLDQLVYDNVAGGTGPDAANFALRARLVRFDTENDVDDARGFIAVVGVAVGLDGQKNQDLGVATIK